MYYMTLFVCVHNCEVNAADESLDSVCVIGRCTPMSKIPSNVAQFPGLRSCYYRQALCIKMD